jgi:hypothetical protein
VARVTRNLIDRSSKAHVDYLNSQKRDFAAASNYFVQETNETERSLCAQLMVVDTVLLTGTLVSMTNKDLIAMFSTQLKLLVAFAFAYLLLSIFLGIRYYFSVRNYNYRWALAKHNSMTLFLDPSIRTWDELRRKTVNLQTGIPQEQPMGGLRLQIIFLGSAAIYYLVALFGLLFDMQEVFHWVGSVFDLIFSIKLF